MYRNKGHWFHPQVSMWYTISSVAPVGNYATAWMDSWRVTQQILYDFRNKFLNLAIAIRWSHTLIQDDPYICNYDVMYSLVH